jgi:hypothetical protein
MRLTLFGCDANLDHGYFERVDVPTLAAATSRRHRRATYEWNTTTNLLDGVQFTTDLIAGSATTQRNYFECAAACHTNYTADGKCMSWVYDKANAVCQFRASPVIGSAFGTASSTYISGNMPEPSATGHCDMGWTGPFCTIRDLFIPPLSLQLPDYQFGIPDATYPTDEFTAYTDSAGVNYTNMQCVHQTVLSSNPSYAASTTVSTVGASGVLPRDQCAKACLTQRLCVAFMWKSNFECTTFRRCNAGLTAMTGLGSTVSYLYVKRDHADRLNVAGNSSWQTFAIGASLLTPLSCATEGSSCSCTGYALYGSAAGWTPPLYLNQSSVICSTAALGFPGSQAPTPRACRCLSTSTANFPLVAHAGSFNRTSYLVDGVRSHGDITNGLWYSGAGWTGEDFVEVPISMAGTHTVAAVIVWSACADPGNQHAYVYNNEGAIVTLRTATGAYVFISVFCCARSVAMPLRPGSCLRLFCST